MTINFNDVTDTATPTSGTFNTGGNSNIRGSGQNFFRNSQNYTSIWGAQNSLITSNATTAPDSTNTASKLIATTTNATHNIFQTLYSFVFPFTTSIYAKASEYNWLAISCDIGGANGFAYFNLQTGVLGTINANFSATITSAGNGWYRCTFTRNIFTSGSGGVAFYPATADNTASFAGDNTSGIFIWGAQLEIGPTANNYVPTTTTAIYGTPTLSLSGVGGLGLQSDGSLYVNPAGTGALQAQPTTSSAVGGNARGANAVDWQTLRAAASRVASGSYSTISGGQQHTSSGAGAFVGGGYQNVCSAYEGAIVGGSSNSTNSFQSFIGGGSANSANGSLAVVVGGASNASGGTYNFIGGGFTNSATSGTAVTTQSATMNGTTAVTLAASNANIKVGQAITGNFITYPNTYVTAISGTSLTISQNASGSGTATLSFFTPFGTVVNGGNNQATGLYSFIGGGGDAGTAANRNVASGDWSFVGGGRGNLATGIGSFIGGGGLIGDANNFGNAATGQVSFVGGGLLNQATGIGASIVGGYQNSANGLLTTIVGGRLGTARSITGNTIFAACDFPVAGSSGVSQSTLLILGRQTTNATAATLTSDTSTTAGTTNQVILPNNSAYFFKGSCIANVTGAANGAAWSFEGAIMRGANAASTVLIDTPSINRVAASAGATTWTIALTADTTNGGLTVTVTGVAATTIRWVAKVETTEVTF